jgi:putative transposase
MPHIRYDILNKLAGAHYFTRIDLKDGFHQILIHAADRHKTSFTFNHTQYHYVGAPFGLKHLPSVFQRVMSFIFRDCEFLRVFIDDIIIFSNRTPKHHMQLVNQVLTRLLHYNLRVKREKCSFLQEELLILGHICNAKGIQPDPVKVQQVISWPPPHTCKTLQAFLGLINWFSEHIPNMATLAAPLNAHRNNKHFY